MADKKPSEEELGAQGTDKPENLDAEVMEYVGRLAFWVIWELANADTVEFVPVEAD